MTKYVNDLGERMRAIAASRGAPEQSIRERLCHLHSEVSEAYKCVRDDDLALRAVAGKPEGLPSELADVIIIASEIAAHLGIDLHEAIETKMNYNAVRPWKRRP